jgi:hypothetical protein
MHELMGFTGWPSEYHELPGRGHWFEGVMTTSNLLRFYNETSAGRRPPLLPLEFSVVIPNSGDMGSKFGIAVDQLQSPDQYGHIKVTRGLQDGIWHLRMRNIHRFHLSFEALQVDIPVALILDDMQQPLSVHLAQSESTWYVKKRLGDWTVSHDVEWRQIGERHGRQLGTLDAILRSSGPFTIRICSSGVERIASQIGRNLFQYFAADSEIVYGCNDSLGRSVTTDGHRFTGGNIITVALGDEMPSSVHVEFPVFAGDGRLRLSKISTENIPIALHQDYDYHYEDRLGAIFLRPLHDEGLELMVWGVDLEGLEQVARLVPSLTGVGQPDFVVMSAKCGWMGHAGVYAAGFFDYSWQISEGSYISGAMLKMMSI